jgi:alcohol dehydrogenase
VTTPDRWGHLSPVQIVFGPGSVHEVPRMVSDRTLLVTTRGAVGRGVASQVLHGLDAPVLFDAARSNPTLDAVDAAVSELRGRGIEALIGLGGGSVIDLAKVLSLALAVKDFEVRRMLDAGHSWIESRPLPMIAVPTTAGTGSEVTPFATLWDADARRKVSVETPNLHPKAAVVDPELATTLPWDVTLSTGLDAFSQCIEALLNRRATTETDELALRGIRLVPPALRALSAGSNPGSRRDMAEAALLSGLAISRTRTGLAHSMSYPITAHLGLDHGLACAMNLPAVVAFNAEVAPVAVAPIARALGGNAPEDAVTAILGLYTELGVADLIRERVRSIDRVRPLVGEMLTPGRADNNLRPVHPGDIDRLLDRTQRWLEGSLVA